MADPQHVELLRQGVEVWNRWRTENPRLIPDLSGANLIGGKFSGADLSEANLIEANLRETDLNGADLSRASLREADLTGADLSVAHLRAAQLRKADLSGANLGGADLSKANLSVADLSVADLFGADLIGADLWSTNLSGSNLAGAKLSGAELYATVFGDTNLTNASGLDACVHYGPSILDYTTLAKSGRLPLAFLRGCGLPETLIQYLPSLLNDAIQFQSCFISYSTKDQEFADRLYADLQNKGVRCWFAPHDIQGGEKIHEQIDTAIQMHDRLLLILSTASMESEWVKTEIAKARKREIQENRRILFPVRLAEFEVLRQWECFDSDTGKDSAREVREYYVPDFTNWKGHGSYQKGFERLLRDLKTDEKRISSPSQK